MGLSKVIKMCHACIGRQRAEEVIYFINFAACWWYLPTVCISNSPALFECALYFKNQ